MRRQRRTARLELLTFVVLCTIAGAIVGASSLVAAYASRHGNPFCGRPCQGAAPYLAIVPFAALARAIVVLRRHPWTRRRSRGYFDETVEAINDALIGSVAVIVFTFLFRSGYKFSAFSYSRLIFVYDWLIATVGLVLLSVAIKAVLGALRRRGRNQRAVVIVGTGTQAEQFHALVRDHPELGYVVVGEIPLEAESFEAEPLRHALLEIANTRRIDEVLLAVSQLDRRQLSQIVGVADLVHLEIRAVPDLFGLPPAKVSLEYMGAMPVMGLLTEPMRGGRRAAKRVMDVVAGSVLLALAAPVMLVVALAIRLTSPGPVILYQERVGMDGRPFRMRKFRTMVADADPGAHEAYLAQMIKGTAAMRQAENGNAKALYKLVDDPRVTPVGRILRRLSMDELPQLFNVIRGEMSIVGPRPPLPYEVAMYDDWHWRRLECRPGLTGLWQVSGRNSIGFDDMVRLDLRYIETWSPVLDLLILARTVPAVLRREAG